MIDVKDVSFQIGSTPILHKVSLCVPKGGVVALVGPNGAGKSTLLSLIARLKLLQAGKITVDGLNVGSCDDRVLARKLAILLQHVHTASRLTVRDLVGFGRYPHHRGRASAHDQHLILQALDQFALSELADRPLDTLSGGQRQRAYVAMTYVQDTDFLLLDEPLNNLDLSAARSLMSRLRDLADHHGRTIVIVLHDINFATAYADRVVVMKDGAVVADGAPNTVVTTQMLRDTFDTSAEVRKIDERPVVLV